MSRITGWDIVLWAMSISVLVAYVIARVIGDRPRSDDIPPRDELDKDE